VLIAGLFHSMHNAIVNSTGLVAVVALPQFEVLVIMAGIVVLATAIIAVATRGRLVSNDHQWLTRMRAEPVEAPTEEELITIAFALRSAQHNRRPGSDHRRRPRRR
jgi:hypothetical protein